MDMIDRKKLKGDLPGQHIVGGNGRPVEGEPIPPSTLRPFLTDPPRRRLHVSSQEVGLDLLFLLRRHYTFGRHNVASAKRKGVQGSRRAREDIQWAVP